jgi:hypothetical protein
MSIACAYALMFFGCRNNFIAIVNLMKKQCVQKSAYGRVDEDGVISEEQQYQELGGESKLQRQRRKDVLFYVATLGIHLVVSIISVFLNNIEDILNLIGAIC